MGCCTCIAGRTEPGILLPDEEILLTQLEHAHPFASKDAEELSSLFACNNLTDDEFHLKCLSLGLSPSGSIPDVLGMSKESFRESSNLINSHYIRLAGILLGRSCPMHKMALLADIYKVCSVIEVYQMLQDLSYVSIKLSLGLSNRPNVRAYIEGLRYAIPNFLINTCKSYQHIRNKNEFLDIFEKDLIMQKLCWSNGIRMMLMEEDIISLSNHSLQSTKRTATGSLNASFHHTINIPHPL